MSCLNLRLPPAKKAWKIFTSKLKLHKIPISRTIKKHKAKAVRPLHKNRIRNKKKGPVLNLVFRNLLLKKRRKGVTFKKKSSPVYVDKLFQDSITDIVAAERPLSVKNVKLIDRVVVVPPSTSKKVDYNEEGSAADDMWESLGFASAQLQGIDEKAERFISKFRAEMEHQEEMLARRL